MVVFFEPTMIAKLRSELGLTLRELADKLGVSEGCVCRWEKGNRYPRPDQLIQIAKLLNKKK